MNHCSIENCQKPVHGLKMCNLHYRRFKKFGDPLHTPQKFYDKREAFAANVEKVGDCLVWKGYRNRQGYGRMSYKGKLTLAHRVSWEIHNGAVPEGMFIDHTCFNTGCVNIGHLRLATRSENNSYLSGVRRDSSTGVRGVSKHTSGRYRAVVTHKGTRHHIGMFDTPEEAGEAARLKRLELQGEFFSN